jgi:predicted Ser/Thr protein kinase
MLACSPHSKRGTSNLQAPGSKLLKKDVFGRIELVSTEHGPIVRRSAREARFPFRLAARRLLALEARALAALDEVDGVPQLLRADRETLEREYIDGQPMQEGRPTSPDYFAEAQRLLRRIHRAGVAHNDLAKEPNLLVTRSGHPAIVDFQLSWYAPGRGTVFRLLAREDLRHLLKHKRTYCPQALTARETDILRTPSWIARLWMKTGKPVYLFVTRQILGWRDREGAGDRV